VNSPILKLKSSGGSNSKNPETDSAMTLPKIHARHWTILVAVVAMALKIYCAGTTFGTNDVMLCFGFGRSIALHGLAYTYETNQFFNHSPLVGEFFRAVYSISKPDYALFPFYLRLPGIIADFLVVLVLIRFREKNGTPPWWALCLFAASPVSFMISGYHGNVDSILVLFLVLATCACAESRPLLCGLFLGLASNIKIIALLLAPVFFFYWLHRMKALGLFLVTTLCVLLGWLAPLLYAPSSFVKNVLSYNSYWGIWGITYWLRDTGWADAQPISCFWLTHAQMLIMAGLKYFIIAAILALAWLRRATAEAEIFTTLALAWIVFFVFSPGICAQYMVWLAPFILVYSSRWYLALTASSALFLFFFYNVISHGMPWNIGVSTGELTPLWVPWSNWPWAVLIACLVCALKKITRPAAGKTQIQL
jgi:hypothetical protein